MTILLGVGLTTLFNFDGSLDQGKASAKAVALLHAVVRILGVFFVFFLTFLLEFLWSRRIQWFELHPQHS